MCLAIPMKLVETNGARGVVTNGGVRTGVMLTLTPEATIGDFVMIHAGYSLSIVDEAEALRTLELLREISDEAK